MRTSAAIFASIATVAVATPAAAQPFPADDEWSELACGLGPMTDAYRDESGALDERDIVGTAIDPAGFRGADADYLYLRLRLDEDPAPAASLRPFAWGYEIDIDGDLTTYEILILVDGLGTGQGTVSLFQNTATSSPNDPTDLADQPEIATYPFADNGRTVVADGPAFGSGPDYFLDAAVPWADLEPLGLEPTTSIYVWAASSSSRRSLDADFACHNGAAGDPSLDGIADPSDPDVDTDGDGWSDADELDAGTDPNDPNDQPDPGAGGGRLEGGGGCRAGPHAGGSMTAVLVLLLACARRRRGRSDARR